LKHGEHRFGCLRLLCYTDARLGDEYGDACIDERSKLMMMMMMMMMTMLSCREAATLCCKNQTHYLTKVACRQPREMDDSVTD